MAQLTNISGDLLIDADGNILVDELTPLPILPREAGRLRLKIHTFETIRYARTNPQRNKND